MQWTYLFGNLKPCALFLWLYFVSSEGFIIKQAKGGFSKGKNQSNFLNVDSISLKTRYFNYDVSEPLGPSDDPSIMIQRHRHLFLSHSFPKPGGETTAYNIYGRNSDLDVIEIMAPENAPGEYGQGVAVDPNKLTNEERAWRNTLQSRHGFEGFASEKIAYRRRLQDSRNIECNRVVQVNEKNLPETSIVICFHNEEWTTLLRSVYSILDRSPPHLIKEIILIDDKSTLGHLKEPLEFFLMKLGKVRLLRTTKRQGIVGCRHHGAAAAQAEVITFLDSHIECYPGWLEPLLERIAEDPTRVVSPVITPISMTQFSIGPFGSPSSVGSFDIETLSFTWGSRMMKRENKRRKSMFDPIRTPTIAGGLFSISKKFFEYLGQYDDGMKIWGSENLEISFKVWMCGGTLEIVPCSGVGHVFRTESKYSWGGLDVQTTLRKNTFRLAEVWLDDYKIFYKYKFPPNMQRDYGDITERQQLRKILHCHSFEWYLKNIYPEFRVPPLTKPVHFWQLKSDYKGKCVDTLGRRTIPILGMCHGLGGNQNVQLRENGNLNLTNMLCLLVDVTTMKLARDACTEKETAKWTYNQSKQLVNMATGHCLTASVDGDNILILPCKESLSQQWTWAF